MFFKEETKGKINGAILGMEFEWFAHNVTYQRLSALNHLGINDLYGRDMDKLMDQAKDVDLGKTKFDDDHGWIGERCMLCWESCWYSNWFIDMVVE